MTDAIGINCFSVEKTGQASTLWFDLKELNGRLHMLLLRPKQFLTLDQSSTHNHTLMLMYYKGVEVDSK